jgi:hypothetical protein
MSPWSLMLMMNLRVPVNMDASPGVSMKFARGILETVVEAGSIPDGSRVGT